MYIVNYELVLYLSRTIQNICWMSTSTNRNRAPYIPSHPSLISRFWTQNLKQHGHDTICESTERTSMRSARIGSASLHPSFSVRIHCYISWILLTCPSFRTLKNGSLRSVPSHHVPIRLESCIFFDEIRASSNVSAFYTEFHNICHLY